MMSKNKTKQETITANPGRQQSIFAGILLVATFLLYYNTIFNFFSLDDNYINVENKQNTQGIKAIPEILTTLYSDDGQQAHGYRALTRISFALEYQFTANSPYNPHISHVINLLLYMLVILVLYRLLVRLLQGYDPWIPFLVALLFMAHPTHTEVVASLKNRDILLHFLFAFLAIGQLVRWIDLNKVRHLLWGMFFFVLALMSKETAVVQLAVFPLVLYFFTDISSRRLWMITGISLGVLVLFFGARLLFLPTTTRVYNFMENPLVYESGLWLKLGTGFYGLLHYLKLLLIPFPLLYYYGYNMIPVTGLSNPVALLSLLIYVALLVIALYNLKQKKLISFIILYYLIHMSMYANLVKPVPGIVADRFVFFSSLSFAMALIWLLFLLFKVPLMGRPPKGSKLWAVVLLTILIVIPYGYYVHQRNKQWRTKTTLFEADMARLENSVKANNLLGSELLRRVNHELAKPVNPYKFITSMIDRATGYFQQAVDIDSSHVASILSLGVINSRINGNQALIRERSYLKQDRPEDAARAHDESVRYFSKAIRFFHDALSFDTASGSACYNLGYTYELMEQWDSAAFYYQREIDIDGPGDASISRLSNCYYRMGNADKAVQENMKIIELFPDSPMPFINLGNYAWMNQDTTVMIREYSKAVELGAGPEVARFLSDFFRRTGDQQKAAYYQQKGQAKQ